MEIPRGRGLAKANVFRETYGARFEIPEGRGVQTKKPSVRVRYGHFLESHIDLK